VAINKANSPAWVKVTLIVLIVAFVLSITGAGVLSFLTNPSGGQATGGSTETTGTASAADSQYQGQVAAITAQVQGDPENYDLLVQLGNTYFDWAAAKQQEVQSNPGQAGADMPLWVAAKDAYGRAVAIKGTESPVLVDYAIVLFYTGETTKAIEIAESVVANDPKFSPAPFNLGIFYGGLGDTAKAIAAFQRYLEIDPTGANGGNPDFAKQQITNLQNSAATTSTP